MSFAAGPWVSPENWRPLPNQWCLLKIELRYPNQKPEMPATIQYDAARWRVVAGPAGQTGDWDRFRIGKVVGVAEIHPDLAPDDIPW